jgi:hypothetical protein
MATFSPSPYHGAAVPILDIHDAPGMELLGNRRLFLIAGTVVAHLAKRGDQKSAESLLCDGFAGAA